MDVFYEVDLTQTNGHLIGVRMRFSANTKNPVISLPSWSPGSYLIRDYARHVQDLRATASGEKTEISKVSKNSWRIDGEEGSAIELHYSVYAYELTVRTSFFDERKIMISPGSVFLQLTEVRNYYINFKLKDNWEVFTSLAKEGNGFIANGYDELVDSPFVGGRSDVVEIDDYTIEDTVHKPCKIVIIGDKGNTDIGRFREGVIKLQRYCIKLFGELPYDRYFWFLFIVQKGGGGLEHKFSNVSIINRWYFKKDEHFNRLMSLEAHEHFHTYNIKRIRPRQLGPFNYDSEVYTKVLWVAEGMTSFYDKISLVRAGIMEEEKYLELVEKQFLEYILTPGRNTSLEQSSFDAWIKLYKPNENLKNSYISYYLKGSLVTFCLDIEIREQTDWKKSLDDFFRGMYKEYKEDSNQGYNEEDLRMKIESYTGANLEEFWGKYVSGTNDLDFKYYLERLGYKLEEELEKVPYIGWKLDGLRVTSVNKDSPAYRAGIWAKDHIVAVNEFEAKSVLEVLELMQPGDIIDIAYFRDSKLLFTKIELAEPEVKKYKINIEDKIERFTEQFYN